MALPNLGPGYRQELSTGEIKQQQTVSVRFLVFYLVLSWVIIVAIMILFYYLMFVRDVDRTVAENYREWSGDVASPSEWKTQTSGEIDNNALTVLENSLLSDPLFQELKNVQVDIPLEPMGKSNPFVPYAPPAEDKFVVPNEDEIIVEEVPLPQVE